jgi:GT2 family glycosyltransferase
MRTASSGVTCVAAVMAEYSRRDLRLACLRSLPAQRVPGVAPDVFVLDDASRDATSEAIADQFPEVTGLHGDGQHYWNGGCGAPSPPPSPATATCARIRARTHQGDRVDPRVNQGPERRRTRGEKVIQCSLPSRNNHRRP